MVTVGPAVSTRRFLLMERFYVDLILLGSNYVFLENGDFYLRKRLEDMMECKKLDLRIEFL